MKTKLIIFFLIISAFGFSQRLDSEEIQSLGDSLLDTKFTNRNVKTIYRIGQDSYVSYRTKSGKNRSISLAAKQLNSNSFRYAQLVYDVNIEYPKCPEFSLLYSHIIIQIDSNYNVKTTDIPEDLNLPSFYWKNDSCSVLDTNTIRTILDTIEFKEGPQEIRLSLAYNLKSKQLVYRLENLLWRQLEPRKSRYEIVVLEAETGNFIRRYEYQYPVGSGW